MQRLKAFKFRIQPTADQESLLNKTFGCTRFVWNRLTEQFNSWDPISNPNPVKITEKTLKDDPEFVWLNEVSAATLQQKRIDFEETKKQFFNKKRKIKLGRPKFKSRKGKNSFRLPNQKFTFDNSGTIRLEKIGQVSVIVEREIPEDADFRSVTISKTPTGKFYASILVQINIDTKPLTGRRIGIDLGLKDLFILSDGSVINNPKWFRENQSKLKSAQQHLSRKQIESNHRNRQRFKVSKIHESISNQRQDFLHKLSTQIVTDYDVICVEDLNVSGMMKNHNLAKSIADASWSTFIKFLDYKCNWYGKTFVKIDRFYPSSKTCSHCGYKMNSMPLEIRDWSCPNCDTQHDRDVNAAKNILQKGFADLTGQEIEFAGFNKSVSVESIEYRHGEDVSVRRCTQPL